MCGRLDKKYIIILLILRIICPKYNRIKQRRFYTYYSCVINFVTLELLFLKCLCKVLQHIDAKISVDMISSIPCALLCYCS